MQITNGVFVDSFYLNRFGIYFLTHWHSDHYHGLQSQWMHGPIYCSQITRKILLTRYPSLCEIVHGLLLNKSYELFTLYGTSLKVIMFDSNHIAGSVMILFEVSSNRYILHTGDMRFNTRCITSNPQLFYFDQRCDEYRCRYQVDTVYIDNTYCDPIFMFPNRSDALKMIKDIIDKNQPGSKMIYLVTDSIGKEEAFISLSLHYCVPVTLQRERMEYVKQIIDEPIRNKLFCLRDETVKRGSWIAVVGNQNVVKELLEYQQTIIIRLTGWANLQTFHKFSQKQYIVPYSLHSNYQQLQLFMSIIRPKKLIPIVSIDQNKSTKFRQNIHTYQHYYSSLKYMKQRGFPFLASHYVNKYLPIDELSENDQNKIQEIQEQINRKVEVRQDDSNFYNFMKSEIIIKVMGSNLVIMLIICMMICFFIFCICLFSY